MLVWCFTPRLPLFVLDIEWELALLRVGTTCSGVFAITTAQNGHCYDRRVRMADALRSRCS